MKIKNITILLDHGIINNQDNYYDEYDLCCLNDTQVALKKVSSVHSLQIHYVDNHEKFFSKILNHDIKPELVINLSNYGYMHNEDDINLLSLFQLLNIPLANAGIQGITFTRDKNILHLIAKELNVPSPRQRLCTTNELLSNIIPFDYPAFLKPRYEKGSCGISLLNFVNTANELYSNFPEIHKEYVKHTTLTQKEWLLQEYLPGREVNLSIIGNKELIVFPCVEVNNIYKYQTFSAKLKMDSHKDYSSYIASKATELQKKQVSEYAKKLFPALKCRDYCRMEFRFDKNHIPTLIDVNCLTSYARYDAFVKSANLGGVNYFQLWELIILTTLKRYESDRGEW